VQGVQQRRREQAGRRQRRQVDEMHAVGEAVRLAARGLDGQPGLADTAGAEHGQQAAGRVSQPAGYLAQLGREADEGRGVGWQMQGRKRVGGLFDSVGRWRPAGGDFGLRGKLGVQQGVVERSGLRRRFDA